MSEADRHPELVQALVVEVKALPLAVCRRAAPQIDDDVEDRAARAAHELADPVTDLEVHPPQNARG